MGSRGRRQDAAGARADAGHSLTIGLLKAGAAQFIVLHHFASYGPMAAALRRASPAMVAWLHDYARIAVQVFLVVGGFLLARSLVRRAQARMTGADLARLVMRRYVRLAWPFGVAVSLAVAVAAAARHWTQDDIIPAPASWQALAAHWLLMHDLLGFESLSTGVWYVAIDFQLYVLVTFVFWFSARIGRPRLAVAAIVAIAWLSLFWVRGRPGWDVWAVWFMYAYGLGALAGMLASPPREEPGEQAGRRAPRAGAFDAAAGFALLALGCALFLAAVRVDWRVLVALATAIVLLAAGGWRDGPPATAASGPARAIRYLAGTSFALFLLHFPVSMIVNAAQDRFGWHQAVHGLVAMAIAWGASMLAAHGFVRHLEPIGERLVAQRPTRGRGPMQAARWPAGTAP